MALNITNTECTEIQLIEFKVPEDVDSEAFAVKILDGCLKCQLCGKFKGDTGRCWGVRLDSKTEGVTAKAKVGQPISVVDFLEYAACVSFKPVLRDEQGNVIPYEEDTEETQE